MARKSTLQLGEPVQFHAEEIAFQLAEIIERRKEILGWDNSDLAKAAGFSARNVRKCIAGRTMSIVTFARLLAALDVPVDVVERMGAAE